MALLIIFFILPSAPAAVSSPPRGWNSYDAYTWHVNETQFLSNCKVLSKRLLPFGYDTCVVDYLWYQSDGSGEWSLDDECRPVPNAQRWPSTNGLGFKPIADKVHAMGLKFGIHIMLGTSTYAVEKNCVIAGTSSTISDIAGPQCGWKGDSLQVNVSHPAGKRFYDSLYAQYAAWGVDFIKNDCIFGDNFVEDNILAQSESIGKVGREMVYSLSPGGHRQGIAKIVSDGSAISHAVNMYRITGDDWDSWGDINPSHFDTAAAFAAANLIAAHGLGGRPSFPDLDMLPLGFIAAPGDSHHVPTHNTSLTPSEQRTQMTLWSMARSPLFFGGDLNVLDDFTFALLTNAEVLRVDGTSVNNKEMRNDSTIRVWGATVEQSGGGGGTFYYAAAFNTGTSVNTTTTLSAADFQLPKHVDISNCGEILDVWKNSKPRMHSSGIITLAKIERHDVAFIRIGECE